MFCVTIDNKQAAKFPSKGEEPPKKWAPLNSKVVDNDDIVKKKKKVD